MFVFQSVHSIFTSFLTSFFGPFWSFFCQTCENEPKMATVNNPNRAWSKSSLLWILLMESTRWDEHDITWCGPCTLLNIINAPFFHCLFSHPLSKHTTTVIQWLFLGGTIQCFQYLVLIRPVCNEVHIDNTVCCPWEALFSASRSLFTAAFHILIYSSNAQHLLGLLLIALHYSCYVGHCDDASSLWWTCYILVLCSDLWCFCL